jgi:hypothetical protein
MSDEPHENVGVKDVIKRSMGKFSLPVKSGVNTFHLQGGRW